MTKIFKLDSLPMSAPIKIKRQPLFLSKVVKPIPCKVPEGKVPMSPASRKFPLPHLKIQKHNQFLYLKKAQPNADSRNSAKSPGFHGNVVLSNNLFYVTPKSLQNQAINVGNNQIYLTNKVDVPRSPVTPTRKLNDSQISNTVQIQNKPMISLKTLYSLKSHDSIQHPIFISKHISHAQKLHLSKFVPIQPKPVPQATPHLSTAQESSTVLYANSINNCDSILPINKNAKTGVVQRENSWAQGKSYKRGWKSICSVVTTSQNVNPVDVSSGIQVKIERLDTDYDYGLIDGKKLATPDSEKCWLETSCSKSDSWATGLRQNLPLGVDYMFLDKAGMKIKTDKEKAGEERKQHVIMKKRPFRDITFIHKEDFECFSTEPFYDKKQKK